IEMSVSLVFLEISATRFLNNFPPTHTSVLDGPHSLTLSPASEASFDSEVFAAGPRGIPLKPFQGISSPQNGTPLGRSRMIKLFESEMRSDFRYGRVAACPLPLWTRRTASLRYSAPRSLKSIFQGRKKLVVLRRRTNTDPEKLSQHRISADISHQDPF